DAVEKERRAFVGTLAYIAPEILRADPATLRSDLYAVGMIAFEVFLGRYPYAANDATSLYRAILETTLPRPDDETDAALRGVLRRLPAKDPADRYADAAEVVLALQQALRHPLAPETVATRESLIRTAPFVGRHQEVRALRTIIEDAAGGRGSAWMVS